MKSSYKALLVATATATAIVVMAPHLRSTPLGAPTFTQTNLVSDIAGMAARTDPNLVNPWGMALGTNSGLWIANNGTSTATTYDGTGQPIPSGSPLVVTIPGPLGTGTSAPTGIATNATP